MRVIARRTLLEFVASRSRARDHQALRASVEAWYREVSRATWSSMADIKRQYGNASPINAERVVFNIKGNHYRLIAAVDFRRRVLFIKWIGSHADYDTIDAATVQYDG
jgi:mRNA interferase HigB